MQQQTSEWHAMRREKIGASDAPIILELSPWKTPKALWMEKLGLTEPPPMTAAMQHGIDTEPLAREAFEKITGIFVLPEVRIHPDLHWMMASMDGVSLDGTNAVEIKCPRSRIDHDKAQSGIIPEKYFPQLQHQMHVCGLDYIYYFSFHKDSQALLTVHRDDQYIKMMIEEEKKFWDCMQSLLPPE